MRAWPLEIPIPTGQALGALPRRRIGALLRAVALALGVAVGCAPPSAPGAAADDVSLEGYRPARASELRGAGWATDFARTEVPISSIRVGGIGRDAFRPIDRPRFAPAKDVDLEPSEPVLVWRRDGEVRAWPLARLVRRELARDVVDGVPVAVTFCSLCATARVWDRRVDGRELDLAVSGLLHRGGSLLYDRGTETLWRQVDGRALAGELAGLALRPLATFVVSFGALADAHPDAPVMLEDGGDVPELARISAEDVTLGQPPSWLTTTCDAPLALELFADAGGAPRPLVLRDPATAPAHRARDGGPGPALGSSAAFERDVDGLQLSFDPVEDGAVDRETGSRWNLLGEAVAGPLSGTWLEPLPQTWCFRFARESLRR